MGDLAGRTVAAVTDSTAMETIKALSDADGLAVDILPFQEYVAAVRALEAGYVDALIDDGAALAGSAAVNPDLEVVGELLSEERYGIGIPNYDALFRDLVNFTLQEMKLDGAYDAIHATWFADQEPYTIELWPGSSPRSSSIRLKQSCSRIGDHAATRHFDCNCDCNCDCNSDCNACDSATVSSKADNSECRSPGNACTDGNTGSDTLSNGHTADADLANDLVSRLLPSHAHQPLRLSPHHKSRRCPACISPYRKNTGCSHVSPLVPSLTV